MGDDSKEATEEEMDQAGDLRGKAAKSYSEGDFEGDDDKKLFKLYAYHC